MSSEYDDTTTIDEILERNKEVDGRVLASHSDAHPLVQSVFMLKVFLGMFGAFILIEPFFITMSQDQLSMQLALFVIQVLVSFVVFLQMHAARIEEVLIRIRSRGYGASQRLENDLPTAAMIFSIVVLTKLVASIVAARMDGLELATTIVLTIVCVMLVVVAVIFVERHKRLYIQLDGY